MIYRPVNIAHEFVKNHVTSGDLSIDATAGTGADTVFLGKLTGDTGKVLSFDIQEEAINATKKLVENNGLINICEIIHDSHENMERYAEAESISAIMFNLGWLPGGNHEITTSPKSTVSAVSTSLSLIKKGGIISICVYSSKEMGYEEKERVLAFVKSLAHEKFTVLILEYANMPNNPPINIFIIKK